MVNHAVKNKILYHIYPILGHVESTNNVYSKVKKELNYDRFVDSYESIEFLFAIIVKK